MKRMAPQMLRSLMRLALAIAAVLVGAGVAGPSRLVGSTEAIVARVVEATARASADGELTVQAAASVDHRSSAPDEDVGAADTDLDDDDDDDDSLSAVSHLSALASRAAPTPGGRAHAIRGESDHDTSRFAAGTGLPRGPPV